VATPFLWALMAKRPDNMAYKEMWLEKRYNRGPLLVLEIIRVIIGILVIGFWGFELVSFCIAIFVSVSIIISVVFVFVMCIASFVAVPIIISVVFVFAKRIQSFYQRIEGRFLGNLNAREEDAYNTASAYVSRKSAAIQTGLLPWDAHIVQLDVQPQASYIGRT